LESELQTAHDLQMGLMPSTPPGIEGVELAGRCVPANHVGGDFYQFHHRPEVLSIAMADVTGHAMEAAIPVVMFNGVLQTQMESDPVLEELLPRLNRSLHRILGERTFVCFAMGQLELRTRVLRLSNSGCPYPFHYRASTGQVAELRVDAYPLGIRPDTTYPVIEVQLAPGDRVVFCSDGIIEAENVQGELFGFERTADVIRQGCQDDLSAGAVLERLMAEVTAFRGAVAQGDDQTVVVLQVDAQECGSATPSAVPPS
jgi:sigma-B regulation protein RsbU (phosphoserine phosphatase)